MRRRNLLATTLGLATLAGCIQGEAPSDTDPTPAPVRHTSTTGPPEVEWRRDYGPEGGPSTHTPNGSPALRANAILRTGGGFVATGENFGAGIRAYVQWLDETGRTDRMYTFGEGTDTGDGYAGSINRGNAIVRATDGGVVVAGTQPQSRTTSNGAGSGGPTGWAARVTPDGSVPWHVVPEGRQTGGFEAAAPTPDGTALAGYRRTDDGFAGWLVTADRSGSTTGSTTVPTGATEWTDGPPPGFHSVTRTSDGGFLLTGGHGAGGWLLVTDGAGEIRWEHRFEDRSVRLMDAVETADGDYLVTGRRTNPDQQATYTITKPGIHPSDLVVRRVSVDGDLEWTRTVDAGGNEVGTAISRTADGGFLVAGSHHRNDRRGVVAAKLDTGGRPQWSETYLPDESIAATDVVQAPDGGFVITARKETLKLAGGATPEESPTGNATGTGAETDSSAGTTDGDATTTSATGTTEETTSTTGSSDPYATERDTTDTDA